jgi:hypothetical protein
MESLKQLHILILWNNYKSEQVGSGNKAGNKDLEEIIDAIKADDNFKDHKKNGKAALAATDKQNRVLEGV